MFLAGIHFEKNYHNNLNKSAFYLFKKLWQKKTKGIFMKKIFPIILLTIIISPLFSAQTVPDPGIETALSITVPFTIAVIVLLFFIFIVMDSDVEKITSILIKIKNYVIPQSTEKAIDLGHDFDGIHELDNRIPPWFNYLFYGTVIFSVIYMLDFHVLNTSKLSAAEYTEEMKTAQLQKRILLANEAPIDENALAILKDETSLTEAKELFKSNCVSCHGNNAEGLVGPNLTDQYWIHGGGVKNIYTTIKKGVPGKMTSWELVYSPKQIQKLASYVISLQGTNPPNARKSEGELYREKEITPIAVKDSVKTL